MRIWLVWVLACLGAVGWISAHAAVSIVHEPSDLLTLPFFRLSPQGAVADSGGTVHAFARNLGLAHRFTSGAGWAEETIDADPGAGVDLSSSIGPDDVIHVLYSTRIPPMDCGTCSTFHYARKTAAGWQTSALSADLAAVMGYSGARALVAGDQGTLDVLAIGISPNDLGLGLYHVTFDGTTWTFTRLLPSSVSSEMRPVALARAADGSLHGALLSYGLNGTATVTYLSKLPAGAWQSRVVRSFPNTDIIRAFVSIAATSASQADIAVSGANTLFHLRVSPSAVEEHVLSDTTGTAFSGGFGYSTLLVTPGQPLTAAYNLVANSNASNDWYQLWIARFDGTSWQNEKVYGTGQSGSGTPVPTLIDPPQLLYAGGTLRVLNKAGGTSLKVMDLEPLSQWTKTGSVWAPSTVIESHPFPSVPGKQVVAGSDSAGYLHSLHFIDEFAQFSMFDGGRLTYTEESATGPTSEIVQGVDATSAAIAVEPSGTVHALAFGISPVTYLRRVGGTWSSEVAGTVNHPGIDLDGSLMAMTLDSSAKVHACIYEAYAVSGDNFDHLRLRYLSNAGGSWINEWVGGDLGRVLDGGKPACAIRVLSDGHPRIAYVDDEGSLFEATRDTSWLSSVVALQTPHNPRNELNPLVDPNGFVHAAFTQMEFIFARGIRYGTNASGIWTEEVVDDDGQFGIERIQSPLFHARIALASDGTVHVSYYDQYLDLMRASVRAGNAWRNTVVDFTGTAGKFGEPVPVPGGGIRFVYPVELASSLRATQPVASPVLFVEGETAFGKTAMGHAPRRVLTLINRGAQALTLNAFSFAPSTDFAVAPDGTTCLPATVLQPEASCLLAVDFSPSTAGSVTEALQIDSNDPFGVLFLKLTGEGTTVSGGSGGSGGGGAISPSGSLMMFLAAALGMLLRKRSRELPPRRA